MGESRSAFGEMIDYLSCRDILKYCQEAKRFFRENEYHSDSEIDPNKEIKNLERNCWFNGSFIPNVWTGMGVLATIVGGTGELLILISEGLRFKRRKDYVRIMERINKCRKSASYSNLVSQSTRE